MSAQPPLILASASITRQKMLQNAGLQFEIYPADLDEPRLTTELLQKNFAAAKIAETLAQQKAALACSRNYEALVIGADQILECDGQLISKAKTPEEAREKLKMLRGRTHRLISAVSIVWDYDILWTYSDEAVLTMEDFSDTFLDDYCARAGEALTRSVGAYELEGPGAWLFSAVRGDYFTILGLPLLPLLHYLKTNQGFGP